MRKEERMNLGCSFSYMVCWRLLGFVHKLLKVVDFQIFLCMLTSHYKIKFEYTWFDNLGQFSSIIKTKYDSYALDYIRGEKTANHSIGYNILLHTSRLIRSWDSCHQLYFGINLPYLLHT